MRSISIDLGCGAEWKSCNPRRDQDARSPVALLAAPPKLCSAPERDLGPTTMIGTEYGKNLEYE